MHDNNDVGDVSLADIDVRFAVDVSSLPFGVAVEIETTFELN